MSRAFRRAQTASWAGHHEAAAKLFAQAQRQAPALRHVALQEALAEARAGRPESGLKRLAEGPVGVRTTPPYRLMEGFLSARIGRLDAARRILDELAAAVPENRVASTALAYCLLRQGDLEPAVALLADPGDNHELLSWAWAELEQRLLRRPPGPQPALPTVEPARSAAAARRLFKAGQAAGYGNLQAVWRRRILESRWLKPLRPLVAWLEDPYPSDALTAFRRAEAAGVPLPGLSWHLGAALYDFGRPAEALLRLDAAIEELAGALAARSAKLSPEKAALARADWEAGEEVCMVRLYRAAALVELRRWDEAEAALTQLADAADDADDAGAGRTHEFAAPEWFVRRGRCRIARQRFEAGRADLERALAGDPAVFVNRMAQITRPSEPTR